MLTLFREFKSELHTQNPTYKVQELLISWLNKGYVPTWEKFYNELPSFDDVEDFEQAKLHFEKLTSWNFLDPLLKNGNEFFFHSPKNIQIVGLNFEKTQHNIPIRDSEWQLWLEIIATQHKQNWNIQNPFVSFYATLRDINVRISMIHGSTSPNKKSKMVVRRINSKPYHLDDFGANKLSDLVATKKNILIAGSTGSGKTSLLTSLLGAVSQEDHLIILEDTFEITAQHPNQTRFLSGDTPETSLNSYLTYCLRLSPDRIILGEMRSSEVVTFLLAMNTGHKGLMATIHASSAVDAINRLSLLFSIFSGDSKIEMDKICELICRNLEYIVFVENKRVSEVIKILGCERGIPFFEIVDLN